MKRAVVLSSFIFSFSLSLFAQKLSPSQKTTVDHLYKDKQVVYFEAVVTSQQEAMALKPVVSIDGSKGTKIRAHATKEQFSKFITMNYKYNVLPSPAVAKKPAAKPGTTATAKKKTTTAKKKTTTSTKK